jgi:murein DD-endopeptidase MepM/ murein hydrolase activator NlpD
MPSTPSSAPATRSEPPNEAQNRIGPARARRLGSSAPADRSAPALSLSPRMTAIFGALFGLATITTIIALLIQAVPPKGDRLAAASASGSAPTAAGAAPRPGSKKRVRTPIPGPWRVSSLEKEPGTKIVSDAMEHRSFVTALTDKGIEKDQVYRILKAFDGVHSFDKTSKNDKFVAAIDRSTKAVKAFEFVVSPLEVYQAKEENGVLTAKQLDMKVADEEVVGSIYIGKSLTKSIEDGGFEPALTKAIDEAFAGRLSSEGLEEGGTLRVIAVEETALGEFARYKEIVAIEYKPPDPAASPLRAYGFDGGGSGGSGGGSGSNAPHAHAVIYVDDKGRSPEGSGWTIPVPGAPITSRFNPKRMHPILHKIVPHTGTDFGAPSGTPIYAAFKGKVTLAGNAGPCGNMVQIDHPGSIQTGYCHMSKFAPGIKDGAQVGTKQLIGYVGTTGRSTGPHLHFWAKKDGVFFDAETLHLSGLHPLAPEEREAFGAKKTELDARLDAIPMPEPPPPPAAGAPDTDKSSSGEKVASNGDDDKPNLGDEPGESSSGDDDKKDGSSKSHAKRTADKGDKSDKPSHASKGDVESGDDLVGADLGGK